jgi:cytochrome c-type biogenesis protein CcmF
MVAERRGTLQVWSMGLVIATFVLTVIGTFLTRSGIVQSVHSFTQSPVGWWFLGGIVLALGGGLALLLWRIPDLADRGSAPRVVSRESAFLFNNVLFLGLTFVVLFGTLMPLIFQATGGGTISVGAPYYNALNVPIFAALLFLMGVGPALPWGTASWSTVRERFAIPVLLAVPAAVVAWALGMRGVASLATLGLAVFVIAIMGDEVLRGSRARARSRSEHPPQAVWRLATRNRRRYGGYLVHAAIALMAVAVAISSTLSSQTTATLKPGESVQLGGYTLTNDRLVVEPLPDDARVIETRAEMTYSGPQSGTLATALRQYPNSVQAIATPAVRTSLGEDLYVTLLSSDSSSGTVTVRVFLNPMVVWIWIGGFLVGVGSVFAIWPDRRRAAAPAPARRASVQPAPAATVAASVEASVEQG